MTDDDLPSRTGLFPQTAWSRVCTGAGRDGAAPAEIREALDDLCRRYWEPARRFLRSLGCNHQDAEDITQTFFANWASPNKLKTLAPGKGRLRSYLKQSLRNAFIDHWRTRQALSRGGGDSPLPLEEIGEPGSLPGEADLHYDKAWAGAVVAGVIDKMRSAYETRGKGGLFRLITGALPGGGELQPYADIAVSAGVTESQIKLEIHRLRRRFADGLRNEVATTIANPGDLEDELRHLLRIMAS